MRLTGWILLLIGLLLCASIAWATLGFLLMGIGLISLQVAERGRQRAGLAAAAPAGLLPPPVGAGLRPPTFEPIVPMPDAPPARQPRRVAWPSRSTDGPYDREAWRRLVESDPDLAQLAKVLADYGPQYVDELAASYLAAPDKSRLGSIVDGIIARARNGQPATPAAPVQTSRPPPLPRPEPQLVIAPEERKPIALPPAVPPPVAAPTPPASPNPADTLEASLFAAVEEASAKAATERGAPPKPVRPLESRPVQTTRREPAFRSVPKDEPVSPPPLPADFEASLFAAVNEAAAKRTEPPKPAPPPERVPVVTRREPEKREPEIRVVAKEPKPAPPPPLPASKPTDDLDESLLAALSEISGEKLGIAKPDATPKATPALEALPTPKAPPGPEAPPSAEAAPSPPVDDDLSEMIKKFAPDSSFLRKQ